MSSSKNIGVNITTGVIWKQLLGFFFPILLGTFFQQLYNTVDMIIVGRFVGTAALSAVGGSAAQIINLIIGFFTGLSAGAGVVISQCFGAGHFGRVRKAIGTAYAFSIAGGILFTVLGIGCSSWIMRIMNTPEDTFADSQLYLRIYFAGIIFTFIFNIGSGILRALGNSRLPLYYLIVCSLLNIVLDLVFVLFAGMGVAGVALATALAQAVSAVLVTGSLMRAGDEIGLRLKDIRFDGQLLRSQLMLGLPGGFQSVMYSLSNLVVQATVNAYGTVVTAAWGTDSKIESFFWMINTAFGTALTTFVGQNYGAGKWDRIKKGTRDCLLMYIGTALFISTLMYIFAEVLFSFFTTDYEVIQYGGIIMRVIVPLYFSFAFIEIFSACLRGIGDVVIPMILTMAGVCLLRIGWILIVVKIWPGLTTIFLTYPVTWGTTAILFIIYYWYRRRSFGPGYGSGKRL